MVWVALPWKMEFAPPSPPVNAPLTDGFVVNDWVVPTGRPLVGPPIAKNPYSPPQLSEAAAGDV